MSKATLQIGYYDTPPLNITEMRKKYLFMLLGSLSLASAAGGAEPKIMVEPSDQGTAKEAPLSVDTKIQVTASGIQIVNGTQTLSVPYSDINRISFRTSPSSLSEISGRTAPYALRRNPVASSLEILGFSGPGRAPDDSITDGHTAFSTSHWNGETIDVSRLAPGIYIVNVDNTTLKFIKQ